MFAGSPTAFLLWAILASLFAIFLVTHLWLYDRFRCLRWSAGRQPGAFRRIMTYCYVCTVPLLVFYGISMTVLKQKEGFVIYDGTVFPKPPELWRESHRGWVVPLNFVIAFIWVLEFAIHLEELTFWLFLLHQGPTHRDWFTSWEFRTWQLGSYFALLALPTIALVTRKHLSTGDAWLFLAGSGGALLTTFAFLHILHRFPAFIRAVKSGGAAPDVVQRLRGFYRLNLVRVGFRFLFTAPLLALSIDALSAPLQHNVDELVEGHGLAAPTWLSAHPLIGNPFITDFMLMLGGIGCFVSSGITLVIFFPAETAAPPPASADGETPTVPDGGAHSAYTARSPGRAKASFDNYAPPLSADGHTHPLTDYSAYADEPPYTLTGWAPAPTPSHGGGTNYSAYADEPPYEAPPRAPHAPPPPRPPTRPARAASLSGSAYPARPPATASSAGGSAGGSALHRAPSAASAASPTLYAPSSDERWDERAEYVRRAARGLDPRAGGGVHPYVASFRSPIDLYDDGEPRAL